MGYFRRSKMIRRFGIMSQSIVILGFFCVMFFSLGGLMTMLRGSVELGVKVVMARDIFICLLPLTLFIIQRLACSHPVHTYQVDVLDGVSRGSEKNIKKQKSKKKTKKSETKVKMPGTFTSPTNDAFVMLDNAKKEPEKMKEKTFEKWMDCYVPFE